ncbi:enoyl-CoA hydratase/isomerase family protein [Ideonella alba]|uniref:Enoyl-CoA hydratase/isomerase family protein n=1 Tax=Ideonella alba TaxID=2824118 RepID=A0A941BBB3_9BURK|nr:enoyl-CoA hydratase-related protein [Ideonella alba]MBQ0930690.1 enoyl-CoA hydratase/isomerase family protein [Ideonella alba]
MSTDTTDGLPLLSIQGPLATVRLNRPQRRHALRPVDLQRLLAICDALNADTAVRAVVLAAEPGDSERPVFCAGYDVAGFSDPQHDPRLFERVIDTVEALRPITLCALSGSVHGGATDLVLACDLRVAVPQAAFHMPATQLGLHYYPSGLRRYVSRLGLNLAQRAFLSGRALGVDELQSVGLFDAVVEPAQLPAAVAALAQRVVQLAPLAAQGTKRSLHEIDSGRADEARLREREARVLATADFAEGRAAIAERRAPRFEGR